MAPNILRAFLEEDPELINIQQKDELPIHCCIRNGENPNVLEFLSILLQRNYGLVNVPARDGMLPIHLVAFYSTVEVIKMLYEYSSSSINVIVRGFGSVAHIATDNQKLEILKYIHSVNPELILLSNNYGRTPLSWAVSSLGL